jgi:hypothetical protein
MYYYRSGVDKDSEKAAKQGHNEVRIAPNNFWLNAIIHF